MRCTSTIYEVTNDKMNDREKRPREKLEQAKENDIITINVPVVYMGRYKVVLRGDYP